VTQSSSDHSQRGPAGPAATRVCPSCKTAGPARLRPDQVCAACEAQAAWSQLAAGEPLVIDRASIDAALRRRQGEIAGQPLWRRALIWLAPTITLGMAAATVWLMLQVLSSRSIGPLDIVLSELSSEVRWTLLIGISTMLLGTFALVRARRRRQFRRLALLVSHMLAIVAGASALVIAVLHWAALRNGIGYRYTSMPPREPLGVAVHVERILDATVVVLAPDAEGNGRALGIGAGAVVARDQERAWIVTCSHVAMPYAATGAWRHARDARPVWVQLSDGRGARALVRWAAPPPIDLAVVELAITDAPEPVEIAPDTTMLQPSSRVTFAPNPYRAGWQVFDGQLIRRETRRTSAGTYDLLYTDLPVIPGDSGTGLYDAQGRLVGLNTWTQVRGGTAHGISLPSETMRVLVDAIRSGRLEQLDDTAPPPPQE
jgi:S1-C subfamily serine protease